MQQRSIVLATRNAGKVREIRQALGDLQVGVTGLEEFGCISEPPETGETFAQNARDKALYYARATGQWCLADDSGLEVDAIGRSPGVQSARYAADRCPPNAARSVIDAANNALLLERLRDVPQEKRTARFVCNLALADPQGVLIETSDMMEGLLLHTSRGNNGFGYDPLFWVPSKGRTVAELDPEEKNAISHRGKALRRFMVLLKDLLTQLNR